MTSFLKCSEVGTIYLNIFTKKLAVLLRYEYGQGIDAGITFGVFFSKGVLVSEPMFPHNALDFTVNVNFNNSYIKVIDALNS